MAELSTTEREGYSRREPDNYGTGFLGDLFDKVLKKAVLPVGKEDPAKMEEERVGLLTEVGKSELKLLEADAGPLPTKGKPTKGKAGVGPTVPDPMDADPTDPDPTGDKKRTLAGTGLDLKKVDCGVFSTRVWSSLLAGWSRVQEHGKWNRVENCQFVIDQVEKFSNCVDELWDGNGTMIHDTHTKFALKTLHRFK